MFGKFVAFCLGAGAMYWGSDVVQKKCSDAYAKSEMTLKNEEEIQRRACEYVAQWANNGELPAVMSIMKQQQAQRNLGVNPQAGVPVTPGFFGR